MTRAAVQTRRVELTGGRVLHVSRFVDPGTGRDRLTLVRGWEDSSPLPPSPDRAALELPGERLPELVEALRELEDQEASG